jgi:phospholipid/cholesterol/gamma-HCH transport system substrate-binding protein
METRARYALIGLFMLAVILGSFAFVYWLENKGGFGQRDTYQIRFQGSVSGLLIGSAVLFNGIRVGEVTNLLLSADSPDQVIATIGVDPNTPIMSDTQVGLETQGLTGGAAVTLRGGSPGSPLAPGDGRSPPMLVAPPYASQDWTAAARDTFQHVDKILSDNSESLHSAIKNIDTFAGALARNSDKVDSILAGVERMTGGGTSQADIPTFDLLAASGFPPPPAEAPSWLLVVPEPTTLMGFNTDKILLQPASGESVPLANARWGDNLPVLFQAKVIQSFENAGYSKEVSRTREGVTGNYQLLLDIRRFHIATSAAPEADVDFVAKLLDQDGKIIAAREFGATASASGSDAKAYVGAFNEALGKLLTDLIDWSTKAIAAAPPPAPPPAAPEQQAEPPMPAEPPAPDAPQAEPSAQPPAPTP